MPKVSLPHCMLFPPFEFLKCPKGPAAAKPVSASHLTLDPQSPFSLSPFWFQNFAILCLVNGSSSSFKKYDGLAFIAKIKNNPHQTACEMWFPKSLKALGMQIRNRSNCHWHLPEKTNICVYTPDLGWLQISQWLIQTSPWAQAGSSSGGKGGKGQSSGNRDYINNIPLPLGLSSSFLFRTQGKVNSV